MNIFNINKKNIFYFALGISFFCNFVNAITVNGIDLNKLLKKDQSMTYTPGQKKDNVIIFEMRNGNLSLGDGDINGVENLNRVFDKINDQKKSSFTSRILQWSGKSIEQQGAYWTGKERMVLQAQASIYLASSIFESPDIAMKGDRMEFAECFFINPNELYVESIDDESNCLAMRVMFNEAPVKPTVINGCIDFAKNQTPQKLILTNVKTIDIQFNPRAWQ